MKRTPLTRKTPLRPGKALSRAGAILRRKPLKAKPRGHDDKVNPDDRSAVIFRDRMCFGTLALLAQNTPHMAWSTPDLPRVEPHQCRDRFGNEHSPYDLAKLTLDHFHHHHGGTKGDRAPSDRFHMVAMCGWLNDRPPSSDLREHERAYARWLMERASQ